ncbi:hypothetical protein ACM16X_16335 [Haloarcula japonica]|uniref:hypothetical protein n=1 Tax=Haloarcula japonica TaxID=29282 RepID=UPI0039F658BB
MGDEIPKDELVKQGFAVLVGDQTVSVSEEDAGNWDAEIEFAGSQSDTSPPSVTGHIVCEECAEAVHNHPPESEMYRGPLPDELVRGGDSPELPISDRALIAILAVIVISILLLII